MQTSRNRTRATNVSILLLKRVKTQPMLICSFSIFCSLKHIFGAIEHLRTKIRPKLQSKIIEIVGKKIIWIYVFAKIEIKIWNQMLAKS